MKMKMKTMKKLLCLLMAIVMVLAVTACGSDSKPSDNQTQSAAEGKENSDSASEGAAAPTGDEKITLRIGTTGYLGRFLSGLAPEESHSACNAVFDSIFRVDPWTKQIKSDVLDDWYWEDEHHFIMKLHDGVYFSNGQKATAEDLLFSYENHEERGSNYLSGMYLDLDKCEILDDFTVSFYCEQQNTRIRTASSICTANPVAEVAGFPRLVLSCGKRRLLCKRVRCRRLHDPAPERRLLEAFSR
jgi:ABC-type transport system substrate-binding protein